MRMIDVQHLAKKYGRVTAVDDLMFHGDQGEGIGLPGPNGLSKDKENSWLFRIKMLNSLPNTTIFI